MKIKNQCKIVLAVLITTLIVGNSFGGNVVAGHNSQKIPIYNPYEEIHLTPHTDYNKCIVQYHQKESPWYNYDFEPYGDLLVGRYDDLTYEKRYRCPFGFVLDEVSSNTVVESVTLAVHVWDVATGIAITIRPMDHGNFRGRLEDWFEGAGSKESYIDPMEINSNGDYTWTFYQGSTFCNNLQEAIWSASDPQYEVDFGIGFKSENEDTDQRMIAVSNLELIVVYSPQRHLQSNEETATSGRKILKADSNGDLHFTYRSHNCLWYTTSADNGLTWNDEELVPILDTKKGLFSLAIDPSNTPYVLCITRKIVWPDQVCWEFWNVWKDPDGEWRSRRIYSLYGFVTVRSIAFELDDQGYGHVAFRMTPECIRYFRFNTTDWNVDREIGYPLYSDFDLDVDDSGNAHLVLLHIWEGVYYSRWVNDHWSEELVYSYAFSMSPQLQVVDDVVHVTWNRETDEIQYRRKSNGVWEDVVWVTEMCQGGCPAELALVNRQEPCIVWQRNGEIYCTIRRELASGFLDPILISGTPRVTSQNPRCAVNEYSNLNMFWTEGNDSPYELRFDRIIFPPILQYNNNRNPT